MTSVECDFSPMNASLFKIILVCKVESRSYYYANSHLRESKSETVACRKLNTHRLENKILKTNQNPQSTLRSHNTASGSTMESKLITPKNKTDLKRNRSKSLSKKFKRRDQENILETLKMTQGKILSLVSRFLGAEVMLTTGKNNTSSILTQKMSHLTNLLDDRRDYGYSSLISWKKFTHNINNRKN